MKTLIAPQFSLASYPVSHGSLKVWRLEEYLHLPVEEQHLVYKQLEQFCLTHVEQSSPIAEYQDYAHIGSGWEWSVFAKDNNQVIKIWAGIFPEVNEALYLVESERNYRLLRQYYPATMVAQTTFVRQDGHNRIEQARLSGQDMQVVDLATASDWLLSKMETLLNSTARMIEEQNWLPDLWLNHDARGLVLRNVMIDEANDQFAIVDFTSYLDPARMYPALCQDHCALHKAKITQWLAEIKTEQTLRQTQPVLV